MLRTVSRLGLVGKVAASTRAAHPSRRTFASTSACEADITVDVKDVTVPQEPALIQSREAAGVATPGFCYHRVAVSDNCWLCLIEAERKYWLARRQEVMDMSRHLNSPHLFFTLSDLRWADKYMQQKELKVGPKELFRRRNPARPSTYNATAHLDQRVRLFIKDFLAPSLGVVHFWYRYEWQEQRSAHVHGFLWLKDAPNFDEINWGLLKDENAAIYKGQDNKVRRFVDYWAPIISASKSIPLQNIPHIDDLPFSEPHETVKSTKKKISVLLNWVQRHTASKEDKLLAKRKTLGQEETPAPDHPEAVHAGNSDWSFSKPRPNRRSPNSYDLASIMRLANVDMKPVMSERALREYVTEYATKPKSALEILAGIAKSSADSKVLNKRLDGWVHSARETTHFLKGIPMVRCSVSFQTLNLGSDGGFWEPMLQEPDNGDEMEGVDFQENPLVSADSWLQRYMRRPPSMEEISLYDVMTKYTWENSKWRKKEDTTHVVLRVYPRFSPIPEDDRYDEYCRTKILLHHSFRNLATILKNEDQSWTGLYTRCRIANHKHPKDTLRSWEKEVRDAPIEKEDLEKPDPKDLLDILLSSKEVPMYVPEEIGQRPIDDGWDLEASRARWKYISEMPTWFEMKDKRYYRNEVTQDDLKSVNIDTLVPEQRKLLDVFTGTYAKILAGESPPQILMNIDGTAGCGKTYLIRAICQELRRMARENGQRDPIRVVAPTGVAALNISGRTINSAFCLPVNANAFMTLSGRKLMHQRLLWEGVHFVIFDEKSMIGSRVLAQVDYRVRQLLPREINKPFSNLNIALIGDFAQFQPVRDLPLYVPPSKSDDDLFHHGSFLYSLFKENHFLKTSHRQSGNSPERIQFRNMLRHVSEGGLSYDEWQTLITRCEDRLSPADRARFKNAMCLFAREVEVETVNLSRLVALNQPCARIMATHVGGPAAAEVDSNKAGLDRCVLLARGAKVMLTRNIWQEQGLVNSTMGVLEDIIWAPDLPRSKMPIAALVSFPKYTGPTLWRTGPRPGFPNGIPILPIVPMTTEFVVNGQKMSRTQLPLCLAWATTIHKAQGLTLPKIKLGLGEKEFSAGLTFVALSRVKDLDSIMFVEGFDWMRVKKLDRRRQLRYRARDFARRYPAAAAYR